MFFCEFREFFQAPFFRYVTLIKIALHYSYSLVNFPKFFRIAFLQNIYEQLPLTLETKTLKTKMILNKTEAYSEPNKTSKMELFAKIVNH